MTRSSRVSTFGRVNRPGRLALACIAGAVMIAAAALFPGGAHAGHSFTWLPDDNCGNPHPMFWAEGPARYWYVVQGQGGHGNCFMYTTTIAGGQAPVNRAWWYTHPEIGPTGSYLIQAYSLGGQYATCGSAFYNVMPSGEFGPNNSYYVNISAGWRMVSRQWLYPNQGAKVYLGDAQYCAVNSTISVDMMHFDKDH